MSNRTLPTRLTLAEVRALEACIEASMASSATRSLARRAIDKLRGIDAGPAKAEKGKP